MDGCMDVWMDGCMHACMHACMYVYIYMYMYMVVDLHSFIRDHNSLQGPLDQRRPPAPCPPMSLNELQPRNGAFCSIKTVGFTLGQTVGQLWKTHGIIFLGHYGFSTAMFSRGELTNKKESWLRQIGTAL